MNESHEQVGEVVVRAKKVGSVKNDTADLIERTTMDSDLKRPPT